MSDFITLSCPSCGGKLQITDDIDRFACAHCGSEHIVRRSGGIVSLKPVEGLLQQTASELASKRLEGEIRDLEGEIADLEPKIDRLSAIHPPVSCLMQFWVIWLILDGLAWVLLFSVYSAGKSLDGETTIVILALTLCFLAMGLGGYIPLRIITQTRSKRREFDEAQASLARLMPAVEEKAAILDKRKNELEKHRSVVRQG